MIICYLLFKIKRFTNGFSFFNKNNEYLHVLILNTSISILLIYFLANNFYAIPFKSLLMIFILFAIIMLIIIQKSFIIYQKQKLLEKTIKDYEQELCESRTQLKAILKDKDNLIKANHEFDNRQKALSLKLDNLMKNNKALFNEEYGSLVERINTLSNEFNTAVGNVKAPVILPKTNIPEIDDMFIYMQSECDKHNIDFSLRLTCDVYQLINNIITKNKLETLIGDLIKNAIIAINYSSSLRKSIMVILGIKNNIYEFSVFDSGIDFEIDTLLKLGKEPSTTHKDSGGTGIGFITTFETLKSCNASLIITEFSDKDFSFTKSITVRFDGENNYIVETNRIDDFNTSKFSRDGFILKNNVNSIHNF